eukprot:382411-Pyramimonas_sp.AAC.1
MLRTTSANSRGAAGDAPPASSIMGSRNVRGKNKNRQGDTNPATAAFGGAAHGGHAPREGQAETGLGTQVNPATGGSGGARRGPRSV